MTTLKTLKEVKKTTPVRQEFRDKQLWLNHVKHNGHGLEQTDDQYQAVGNGKVHGKFNAKLGFGWYNHQGK